MHSLARPLLLANLAIATIAPGVSGTRLEGNAADLPTLLQDAAVSAPGHVTSRDGTWSTTGSASIVIVTRPQEAPFPFSAIGAYWKGKNIRIEVAIDAIPDRWFPLSPDPHGEIAPLLSDGRANPAFGQVVASLQAFGSNRSFEYRLRVTMNVVPGISTLEELSLVFLDSVSGKPSEAPDPGIDSYPMPPYYDRDTWGAAPPNCTYDHCTVTHLGLHHTASAGDYYSNGFSDCAANVRGHQAYHMGVRGWCDIGYNFLVCKHGKAWEGRGGDDVRGAHDGYNCGSMGTAAMGYFHSPHNDIPTPGLVSIIVELFAWKADQRLIDPYGRDWYSGYGGAMDNIYGHRDVGSTSCPGDILYPGLGAIRADVAERMDGDVENLLFDNTTSRTVGNWSVGNTAPGRYGPDYRWTSTQPAGTAMCFWPVQVPSAGTWDLFAWWPQGANRTDSALVGARIQGTTYVTRVNQQSDGGQWNYLGSYFFPRNGRSFIGISNNAPSGSVVIADAMRLVKR